MKNVGRFSLFVDFSLFLHAAGNVLCNGKTAVDGPSAAFRHAKHGLLACKRRQTEAQKAAFGTTKGGLSQPRQ